ncbi:copper resistance protein CopC [Xylophilus sp. Kf1]|nr:copper resistance protein CopC [Xylophilus sp. Kf1]
MQKPRIAHAILGALLALAGTAVQARPQLVGSTPADHDDVEPTVRIALHFSQKLRLPASGAVLFMTSMPGVDHHPQMGMAVDVTPSDDGRTLLVVPGQPLPRGTYRVDWKAVAADRHPVRGRVDFRVP